MNIGVQLGQNESLVYSTSKCLRFQSSLHVIAAIGGRLKQHRRIHLLGAHEEHLCTSTAVEGFQSFAGKKSTMTRSPHILVELYLYLVEYTLYPRTGTMRTFTTRKDLTLLPAYFQQYHTNEYLVHTEYGSTGALTLTPYGTRNGRASAASDVRFVRRQRRQLLLTNLVLYVQVSCLKKNHQPQSIVYNKSPLRNQS